jgi:hypothetical protein
MKDINFSDGILERPWMIILSVVLADAMLCLLAVHDISRVDAYEAAPAKTIHGSENTPEAGYRYPMSGTRRSAQELIRGVR